MKICSRPVESPKPELDVDDIRDIIMAGCAMHMTEYWEIVIDSMLHAMQAMGAIDAYTSHRTRTSLRIEYKVIVRIKRGGDLDEFFVSR